MRHRLKPIPASKRGRLPGPVDQRLHQQLERRHRLRHAEAVRRAHDARAERRRHRRRSSTSSSSAIQDAFIADLPAAAGDGPGHHRRLQAADRGPRPAWATPRCTAATQAPSWQGRQARPSSPGVSSYQVNVPQLDADIDRTKAKQLGVPLTDVFETMQIYLGSLYVNDFNRFGRTYQVVAQADAQFRARAEDIGR
jgi:multidrug efflux pump subunit AcrB